MKKEIKQLLENRRIEINKKNTLDSDNNYIVKSTLAFLIKIADRKNYNGKMTESSLEEGVAVTRFTSEDKIAFWIQQRTLLPLRSIKHALLRLKLQGYWKYNKDLLTVDVLKPMSEMLISKRFLQTEIPDYMCKQFILKDGRKINWTIVHQMIYDDINRYENTISTPIIPINELGQLTEKTFYKSLRTMSRENFVDIQKLNKIIKDIDSIFHGRRFCTEEELQKRVHYTSRSKRTSVVARKDLHEYILKFQREECKEVKILRLKKKKVECEDCVKIDFIEAKERNYTVNTEKKEKERKDFQNNKNEQKKRQVEIAQKFKNLCKDLNYKCSYKIPDKILNNDFLMNGFKERAEKELRKVNKFLFGIKEIIKKKAVFWEYCKYRIKEYLHIPQYIEETQSDLNSIKYIWNNLLIC